MGRKLLALLVLTGILTALVAGAALAQESGGAATAELRDGEGNTVGTAEFVEGPGGVVVTVSITGGIEPGEHGIHIHEKGDLSDPSFKSAGGHFNPTDAEHGFDNPNGPHAGDLENITVAEDGTAYYQTVNDRITLSAGPNSILDGDGSALIVHAMPDDYTTDDGPDGPGMSGDRIAAGEIEAAEAGELVATGGPSPLLLLAAAATVLFLITASGVALIARLRRRA